MASQALTFGRDSTNRNAYAPYPSNNIFNATITNGNATHCTVPVSTDYLYWGVSYRYYPSGVSVFVDVTGATAAIPVGSTLVSATSEGNPASHTLPSGANISVITAATSADVTIVMWPIQQS